jgi:SAM-dependent methyltransferase
MDELMDANRRAWDALAKTHYEHYHIEKLLAGKPLLSELVMAEVGEVRGKSLLHLLCHIGTDTLSWGLLGAEVTGLDISPESIRYARLLAEQLMLPASFIEADVMALAGQLEGQFEVIFASTGVLCWIADLKHFARTVHDLLKPGGFFYLHDGHPIRYMLVKNEQGEMVVKRDYFATGMGEYEGFTDYTTPDLEVPGKLYEWDWTLGEVVTAFSEAGLRVAFLHEHPQYFYSGYTAFDVEEGKRELYPCTFSLKVVK